MTKEEKYFNDGLDAYNNKGYDDAINYFSELIDKFSNSVDNAKLSEIYYMRGICHAQEYSIDEALKDFSEAEKLGFDKSKIYCGVGIAYAHNGENNKAIANFNKAIKLNNVYEEAYCRRGIAYTFMEKYDEAMTDFNRTIELNNNYVKAYYYRGLVYYNKNEYGKAIKDFDRAIELDDKYIFAYNNRGLIYYWNEEYDKALDDFNKAIELDDEFIIAYRNRGLVYFNNNEYDEAFENFKKFDSKIALYYMVEHLLKEEKDIDDILNLLKEYTDDYFNFITNGLEKEEKNKFLKLWIYQYILLDLLFINNYEEIEEFSHYTTQNLFEYFIDYNKKECNIQSDSSEYLRLTSISKTNDPQDRRVKY